MNLQEEFLKKDGENPFSRRVLTFAELYLRYIEIKTQFFSQKTMGKKEKYDLLLELEVIKNAINKMLPEYNYPNKK